MAVISSMTLARLLSLEAGTVINGSVDANGNLILTTHDGTQINAGLVKGTATPEAILPTPSTLARRTASGQIRAVGPVDDTDVVTKEHLEAYGPSFSQVAAAYMPGFSKYESPSESEPPSYYPNGITLYNTGSGLGWPVNIATIVTVKAANNARIYQEVTTRGAESITQIWRRAGIDASTWSEWYLVHYDTGWTNVAAATAGTLPTDGWTVLNQLQYKVVGQGWESDSKFLIYFRGSLEPTTGTMTQDVAYRVCTVPWRPVSSFRESLVPGINQYNWMLRMLIETTGHVSATVIGSNSSGYFGLGSLNGIPVTPV